MKDKDETKEILIRKLTTIEGGIKTEYTESCQVYVQWPAGKPSNVSGNGPWEFTRKATYPPTEEIDPEKVIHREPEMRKEYPV